MTSHAMLNSAYPPSEGFYFSETIEEGIALLLCHGASYDEVYTYYTQDPEGDPWQDRTTGHDGYKTPVRSRAIEQLRYRL